MQPTYFGLASCKQFAASFLPSCCLEARGRCGRGTIPTTSETVKRSPSCTFPCRCHIDGTKAQHGQNDDDDPPRARTRAYVAWQAGRQRQDQYHGVAASPLLLHNGVRVVLYLLVCTYYWLSRVDFHYQSLGFKGTVEIDSAVIGGRWSVSREGWEAMNLSWCRQGSHPIVVRSINGSIPTLLT